MNRTRIILSFDDGRKDNYDIVMPILKKYKLTATFNITTAYVDGTINDNDKPCPNEAMTVDNIRELATDGFEIAAHGDCHRNDWTDIRKGAVKLSEWMEWADGYRPGFASPKSNLSREAILADIDKYKRFFSYIRIALDKKDTIIKKVIRKMAHVSHSRFLYRLAFADAVGGIREGYIAVSIPVLNQASAEQINGMIEYAENTGEDCILMFHSVVFEDSPYHNDTWSWDAEKFIRICTLLNKKVRSGEIEVVRTIDLLEGNIPQ